MPRYTKPLNDLECRAAKPRDKDYSLFDGDGLYLLVKPSGSKSWRFKYTKPNGKQGLTSFGAYPLFSLAEARGRRDAARKLLAEGIDPVEQKQRQREEAEVATLNNFEHVAREWHTKSLGRWSPDHARRVLQRLEADIFPDLGPRAVDTLKTRDLLMPLRKVEARGAYDLASRLRQHVTGIMRYAVQTDLIESNPAADLTGALAVRKQTHMAALPMERLPELLARLEGYKGRLLTQLAVRFALLTFVRSSEMRMMRWAEVDLVKGIWTIPAEREEIEGAKHSNRGAKMRTPHIVPLSMQAQEVLQEIHQLTGQFDLVFAGDHDPKKPMSENTVNAVLRRMGYDTKTEICGHGFRTMACSALNESGHWSKDAIERQMSHQERNGVRAAYIHKAEYIAERRKMMQWWADYLSFLQKSWYVDPADFK